MDSWLDDDISPIFFIPLKKEEDCSLSAFFIPSGRASIF
jgi:hypothetical protein